MNIGGSNRLIYDNCAYQKQLYESVAPINYMINLTAHENCNKCIHDHFWLKQDPQIVDTESELLNLTRPLSKCDSFKYNPNCGRTGRSGLCISTFHKDNPKVLAPEVCPIIYNNIPRQTDPGFRLPEQNVCKGIY